MEKNRIIMAFVFTLIACNAVLASSPGPLVLVDSFINQEPPWNIGATSEDSVIAEFSPDEETLIIRGRGKMMGLRIWTWDAICEEKNKLSKVFIESGVTYIGGEKFFGCKNLKAINVASDNNAYSSKDGVLYNKNFSTLIKYPEGKSGAAIIPDGVTSIELFAFGDNKNLTSIYIPASVTSILVFIFSGCENLKAINVASDNNEYSSKDGVLYNKNFSHLIYYPEGKSGIATIPDGVISIGFRAFYKNKRLTSIIIPNSVTFIGTMAFYNSNLSSITIPDSVTDIANLAFSYSEKLTSITISSSVISIGNMAFSNCENLTSITILNPVPSSLSFDKTVFEKLNKETCILYVPKGSVDAYRQANVWKDFKNIEPIE